MPESLSLPHLTAGSFQLQPLLKLYVALLVRATPGCSRPTLTFQSFWLHKHPGPQSGFLARKCSSLSWHWKQISPSAPAFGFPQNCSRKFARLKVSAQRLRPCYWLILSQLAVTSNSKRQPSKLLWEPLLSVTTTHAISIPVSG